MGSKGLVAVHSPGWLGIGGLSNGSGLFAAGGGTTGTGVVGVAANGLPPTPGTVRAGVYGNAQGSGRTGTGIWGIGNDIGARGDVGEQQRHRGVRHHRPLLDAHSRPNRRLWGER